MLRYLKKCWLENCRKARAVNRKMKLAKSSTKDLTKLEELYYRGKA